MLLGIDVGGTHTDAVLLTLTDQGFSVAAWAKIETDHASVVSSVRRALGAVLAGHDSGAVSRFTLSTTLTTNALAQGTLGEAALILVPGPGMAVEDWAGDLPVHVLSGAMDHRGRETAPLDPAELTALTRELCGRGIRSFAVAGKFATRNPAQEKAVVAALGETDRGRAVSVSHRLSGMLNFPRRAVTTFYNAALWSLHAGFADAVGEAAGQAGISPEPLLLMAHGGSVPLSASREQCVEAANSGPAASVLGILALEGERLRHEGAVLFCDIGGSTTDLALMAYGSPVTAREGLTLGGRRTSVPGLATMSIPLGGDSPIMVDAQGRVGFSPERKGPCLAAGGPVPTLTDALNVLGYASWGNGEKSLRGLEGIAQTMRPAQGGISAREVAHDVVQEAGLRIHLAAESFVAELNARPVYTVAQLLAGAALRPVRLCLAGGAGAPMGPVLEKMFGLPVVVPGHAAVANAVGAALARVSVFASLYADTAKRVVHILPDGGTREVASSYSQDQAVADVTDYLRSRVAAFDPAAAGTPVDIVSSDAFAMHDERGNRLGRTFRVLARMRPGLVTELQGPAEGQYD